jgi:quercetin dioxygenase-like cupin family protein
MITVVNRDYCKKLIFVLPGQIHPEMFHKKKDETFFVLFGSTEVTLDGVVHALKEGDALSIPPRVVHGFTSDTGAIIEEVSSTHFGADSFYLDDEINSNPARKTIVQYWL